MAARAPLIDARDEDALVMQTEALVQSELAAAQLVWTPSAESPDMAHALVRIFARMARHVVESVNRIPDKGFLQFLNLIGAAQGPPHAARVPLTFSLAPGAAADVLVPAGARAAAPPPEGESEEVVFETESPLVVTRAALASVVVHRPDLDLYSDRTAPGEGSCPLLQAEVPTPHLLFVDGGAVFALPGGTPVQITIGLPEAADGVWTELPLTWTYWDGATWQAFPAGSPITTVEIDPVTGKRSQVVSFDLPDKIEQKTEGGRAGRFVRGELGIALPDPSVVPVVDGIALRATVTGSGLSPDQGFAGSLPLDMSLDFHPFGERPRIGDAFFLVSEEVFSRPGAAVTLHVERSAAAHLYTDDSTDPGDGDDPTLIWEVSTAQGWLEIGRSDRTSPSLQPLPLHLDNTPYVPGGSPFAFADGTMALTKPGAVTFHLPQSVAPLTLRGVPGHWLRVRVARGVNVYGRGLVLSFPGVDINGTTVNVASVQDDGVRPPILSSLKLDFTYAPAVPAGGVVTYDDFHHADRTAENGAGFAPFTHDAGDPALCFGFDRPFDNGSASLFFVVAPPTPLEISAEAQLAAADAAPPVLVWEYSGPDGWSALDVDDETDGLRRSGPVRFIGPADFTSRIEYEQSLYWIRVRLVSGDFGVVPGLRCVRTSTVWARQATTYTDEVLGSSDGRPHQRFRVPRAPVLGDPRIDVFEPVRPGPDVEAALHRVLGEHAVTPVEDDHGHPTGAWVRWLEVTDFHASGPADRHYVLDHATGTLQFGGGGQGMAPPAGTDNIRASRYQVGGGARGNCGPGEIKKLVRAPLLVAGVENHTAAAGGTDMETFDHVRELGPRLLRHGQRAVAAEDFEDLAREASPEVARALALTPGFDPLACAPSSASPPAGQVLLVVVPHGSEARPIPTLSLLDDVADHLRSRAAPALRLALSGPDWVRVTADIQVVPTSLDTADTVGAAVLSALERYLHPLTGGAGSGWDFGAVPRASDLYPVLTAVAGVDHIRKLHLVYERETGSGWTAHEVGSAALGGRAPLIFSGPHTVSIHQNDGD